MPSRWVFDLEAQQEGIPEPFGHAKGLQSWVYEALRRVNPALARRVHEQATAAFTLSPLGFAADGRLGFDLTLLDDALEGPIREGIDSSLEPTGMIALGAERFACPGPVLEGRVALLELWDGAPVEHTRFQFEFRSPMATKASTERRLYEPCPIPVRCAASWQWHWNWYAPAALRQRHPAAFLERVRQHLELHRLAGSTVDISLWDQDRPRTMSGFVGEASFRLVKGQALAPDDRRLLAALARYADWCGTGVELTRGMGQTRLIGSG